MEQDIINLYKQEVALLQTEVRLQNERFAEMQASLQRERDIKAQLVYDISKLRTERTELIRLANSVCASVRLSTLTYEQLKHIFSTVEDYEKFVNNPLY